MRHRLLTLGLLSIVLTVAFVACTRMDLPDDVAEAYAALPDEIDFNRDVKRILSDKCFTCHGPDARKQKADLRLDIASFAYEKTTESGRKAIRPGDASASEVAHRILSTDPEYRMPTPESHLVLTAQEKAILIKWMEQGAEYKPHWAFVVPQDPDVPSVDDRRWSSNDIDRFILRTLEDKGLRPAAEADRETLLRRLSFDIRGFAPSIAEIDAFLADKDPKAYEKRIDLWLASPHYGERMAAYWLDVARFADSHGYLDDKHRDMSPWRDWVVSAYNRNIPYDKFVTWQLAGDLLPNPTQEQILATGFNRNHKQNSEAGIIEEEYRVEYVTDRTNTLGTALMAMTLGCAKCHDHKYDPVSQKDYYSLFAFFNSTFEKGSPNYGGADVVPGPTVRLSTPEQDRAIAQWKSEVARLEAVEQGRFQAISDAQATATDAAIAASLASKATAHLDFDRATVKDTVSGLFHNDVDPTANGTYRKAEFGKGVRGRSLRYNDQTLVKFPPVKLAYYERHDPFSLSIWIRPNRRDPKATVLYHSENHRYGYQGWDLLLMGNRPMFRLSHAYPHDAVSVVSRTELDSTRWTHLSVVYDGSSRASGVTIYIDGKPAPLEVEYDHLYKNIRQRYSIHKGAVAGLHLGEKGLDKSMPGGEVDEFYLFDGRLTAREVSHLFVLKPIPSGARHVKVDTTELLRAHIELNALYDTLKEAMVMGDLPQPRKSYLLQRGNYDSHGEEVQPSTPASILSFPEDLPRNRLGLARWLFDERNPLTARVAVNRIWQLVFGKGIVATSDDFGNQGAQPTHPELLDHLAVWYREHGWDTKALLKYILMSSTYRQSSVTDTDTRNADPDGRWLSRHPRYRWPAEMLRDNALAAAGLLSMKIGGPSVYPYQPAGLWEELSDKAWRYTYELSPGEDRFRKSIYTVRKRTSVVPFLQIFDAPDRNFCTVRRTVSSSPMQPLAMLNDPQIFEAARFIGLRMQREGGGSVEGRLALGFRIVTGRRPSAAEADLMRTLYTEAEARLKDAPMKVKARLSVGSEPAPTQDPLGLACLAEVAHALMNTDEFLTRK
jgi:hypothetical protein